MLTLPCCVWLLAVHAPPEAEATIAYVRSLQKSDGGFFSMTPPPNVRIRTTLRATSAAVRALKYLGGSVPDKAKAAQFVAACFDAETGAFADAPGLQPEETGTTALGLMAVKELGLPPADYRKAIRYLATSAKSFEDVRLAVAGLEVFGEPLAKLLPAEVYQAWGKLLTPTASDIRDYAGAIAGLYRLGVEPTAAQKATLAEMMTTQLRKGAYGKPNADPDLETTYRVLRALVRADLLTKMTPEQRADLRKFVAACATTDGSYTVAPNVAPSTISATYYASVVIHWLAEAAR